MFTVETDDWHCEVYSDNFVSLAWLLLLFLLLIILLSDGIGRVDGLKIDHIVWAVVVFESCPLHSAINLRCEAIKECIGGSCRHRHLS